MPAVTPKVIQAERHIEEATPLFPNYVQEYIQAKKKKYSPLTLSGYLYNIEKFFNWLLEEGIVEADRIRDIDFDSLATLKKIDVELFVDKMANEILSGEDDDEPKRRSKTSVARAVQALKSLFHYLTVETEDKVTQEPYFNRNVMLKITVDLEKESKSRRSKRIEKKTYKSDEIDELLEFISGEYTATLSSRELPYFEMNKVRDLAILAVLFGSGIRGNELVGLKLKDVYIKDQYLDVIRKGDKADSVVIRPSSLTYLVNYLNQRSKIYNVKETYPYVFVAKSPDGTVKQMSNQTLIRLVKKYTQAYGKEITPHKARYTFSRQYQLEGGTLIGLRDQLGHQNIETTSLYTTESMAEQKDVVNRMDKPKNKK
ncbi:tyrosine recombinase XerS [Lysinibacillus sp. NPDC097214]|uniref:tyrosine recombinase XerS n=1 Tax=Lysinibacillus sp. NPDC097214 TaxID=3390584 RepID=UPI003D016061